MTQNLPTVPDFPKLENKWLKHWEKTDLVKKYREKNQTAKKRFSFFDGPITANNPMGVHHGWGRTYKDLWQRFHNLLGYQQRFQNGFDCQGLWVEVEVEKELKLKNKKQIEELVPNNSQASIAKFVKLCKERVYKYAKVQTKQSQRLGYFMDWENSYFTMADENNYMIWHFLKVCFDNGWIYKGKESVPWCPRCETAISQHEMLTEDYKEVTHEAVYIKFKIQNPNVKTKTNEYLLVWTTTPWTIPANIAVAVDEKLDYALVQDTTGDHLWLAKDLVNKVFNQKKPKVIKVAKGKALVGLKYKGPFDHLPAVAKVAKANPKTFHTVIPTNPVIMPVNLKEGTGLVHTAVSAGTEDFKLGKKLGLPMIPVIADNADYLPELGFLSGQNAKKNPRLILDYLEKEDAKPNINWVFLIENYKHRYPACWRCKTELVWKVTEEWYIAMDKPGNPESNIQHPRSNNLTLRQMMIETAKKINWLPEFGLDRELDWLNNMHDWLISKKNRYWGLALPIYECKACGHFEVIGSKEELKNKCVSGWDKFEDQTPHRPWIDEVKIECSQCQKPVSRILDVGNPWLDAGIIPYSTLIDPKTKKVSYLTDQKYWQQWFPADFITESFPGQFKNWFYSMIAMSTVLEQTNPFKTVLGFATLLAEDGRAMHKSWGNAIEFNEAADKIGVDVMRWLYVRQDPKQNLLFGFQTTAEIKRFFHIPLWNILKFYLTYSELDQLKAPDSVDIKSLKQVDLSLLDEWIISRTLETEELVKISLQKFQPKPASQAIEALVMDLSQWYLRLSRSRVWVNSNSKSDKQAFYTTLKFVLLRLTTVLSIFLPFFSEEIFSLINSNKQSVHLQNWPDTQANMISKSLHQDIQVLRRLAELGHSARKKQGIKVRQPLGKAVYKLGVKDQFVASNNQSQYLELLQQELNLKKVELEKTKAKESSVTLETKLTEDLVWEGKVRDYLRQIQRERQKQNLKITDLIILTMPKVPDKYLPLIKQKVLAKKIELSDQDIIQLSRAK